MNAEIIVKTAEQRREDLLHREIIDGWSTTKVKSLTFARALLRSAGFVRQKGSSLQKIPRNWTHGNLEAKIETEGRQVKILVRRKVENDSNLYSEFH